MDERNMTKVIQDKELDMLKELSDIFERNGIRFFLACGTALGCARHKGFIPWDDDVDIYIIGCDYEKVRSVFATQDTGNLQFQDYSTTDNYPFTYPKIVAKDTVLVETALKHLNYECGVFIDVFPLMGISDNRIVRQFKEFIRYYRYSLLKAYYFEFKSKPRKLLNWIARRFVSPKKVQEKLFEMYKKSEEHGEYVIDTGVFWRDALVKRSSFCDIIKMPFENCEMPMAIGYERYLEDYYGDWNKLPEEKDRVSGHYIEKLEIM